MPNISYIQDTIRICHEFVKLIDKSVPRVTVGHHEVLPNSGIRDTLYILSIPLIVHIGLFWIA